MYTIFPFCILPLKKDDGDRTVSLSVSFSQLVCGLTVSEIKKLIQFRWLDILCTAILCFLIFYLSLMVSFKNGRNLHIG